MYSHKISNHLLKSGKLICNAEIYGSKIKTEENLIISLNS